MGLFSKFKKEKTAVDWSNAYTATPKFYARAIVQFCLREQSLYLLVLFSPYLLHRHQ